MFNTLIAEDIFLTINSNKILEGCTLSAKTGQITGLLGRNGAGKTSLLKIIYGTLKGDHCNIHLNGATITSLYSKKDLVNYLPQNNFFPNLTLGKILKDYSIDESVLFNLFPELCEYRQTRVLQLSTGLIRLFSVLVILLQKTKFSILDEPFCAISPVYNQRLQDILTNIKKEKGIIITDHLYQQILQCSDMIFLVKNGQSIYIRDPNDLVVHGYLNSNQNI
jgi:ABC-type branched-subunit amino acid transport system ATPase component